ncbi:MAG TPA: deoxyguanosinetriphosphate triphosphohydrolase, partial [Kiloniellales bacterium]
MTGHARLAPFACLAAQSRGRLRPEPESPTRTGFQRDRDRVIHSVAFRRLKHKTQVFVYHEGDHYRTRLTHSIEVAQIARSISRALGLDEDLAEAVALAHDLGHTPFGHAGEEALDKAMAPYGGFDHNEQTFRILTKLERHYAEFDGLNLTWETLEGVVKHNGPLRPVADVPRSIAEFSRGFNLELGTHAGGEAQVAALADDIAYNNHDIDDGLRAGLFTVRDLDDVPVVGAMFGGMADRYPGLDEARLIHESIRRLIDHMVTDLLAETRGRLAALNPHSAQDIRDAGAPVVAFSERMRDNDRALKAFLFARMYRHDRVIRMIAAAHGVVEDLFALYLADPGRMPAEWQADAAGPDEVARARVVGDYIAGMTDRFALAEHRRLTG